MSFAEQIIQFQQSLDLNLSLPEGVGVLNPYQDAVAAELCRQFYYKFYDDDNTRTLILGINPGRFGGGITGVPFTDPLKLAMYCGIPNDLKKKVELSADFIYKIIEAFGGPEKFYRKFYISALSPLGFVKDGKNLNYYDIKELQQAVEPFMIRSLQLQLEFGANRDVCFCLGEGKNFNYLNAINQRYGFFNQIIPLSHPRFIMQYRRKSVDAFVKDYLRKLALAVES
jgi:hypothetical protein